MTCWLSKSKMIYQQGIFRLIHTVFLYSYTYINIAVSLLFFGCLEEVCPRRGGNGEMKSSVNKNSDAWS